jgi:hypothetical protein
MYCPNSRLYRAHRCVRTHPGRTRTHPSGASRTGRPHRAARTHPESASGRTRWHAALCTNPHTAAGTERVAPVRAALVRNQEEA